MGILFQANSHQGGRRKLGLMRKAAPSAIGTIALILSR